MSIAVMIRDFELTLTNVYIPPVNSAVVVTSYRSNILPLLQGDNTIVMGDFNAHRSLWYSSLSNNDRGNCIVDQIEQANFVPIKENLPTRVTSIFTSSPDISIVSALRTYLNHHKADWAGFSRFLDGHLGSLGDPLDKYEGERVFRDAIIRAAKRFIPMGMIERVIPHFPAEAARLSGELDRT